MTVAEGEMAPDFEMPATGGRTVSLSGYKGKPFILYFYPKADTPGCTKEACAFQEAMPEFEKIGLAVIGVSPDKIKPIEKFAAKYGLTFPLASDGVLTWWRTDTEPGSRSRCTDGNTWGWSEQRS